MDKSKKSKKSLILLISAIAVLVLAITAFTFAWFTDSKSYSNTLTFGEIKLDVGGGLTSDNKINFTVARTINNVAQTWDGKKVYPGDKVNIAVTVALKDGCGPAYYLLKITDSSASADKVFKDYYYFNNGGTVYVSDGTKVWKQSDTAQTAVNGVTLGKIDTAGTAGKQSYSIAAEIATSRTTQGGNPITITCKVAAIQQYNITEANALTELKKLVG